MMDFVAVKLKIIAGLGGLCGDYRRWVEYVQAKCAMEISIIVVGSENCKKKKEPFFSVLAQILKGINCVSWVLRLV